MASYSVEPSYQNYATYPPSVQSAPPLPPPTSLDNGAVGAASQHGGPSSSPTAIAAAMSGLSLSQPATSPAPAQHAPSQQPPKYRFHTTSSVQSNTSSYQPATGQYPSAGATPNGQVNHSSAIPQHQYHYSPATTTTPPQHITSYATHAYGHPTSTTAPVAHAYASPTQAGTPYQQNYPSTQTGASTSQAYIPPTQANPSSPHEYAPPQQVYPPSAQTTSSRDPYYQGSPHPVTSYPPPVHSPSQGPSQPGQYTSQPAQPYPLQQAYNSPPPAVQSTGTPTSTPVVQQVPQKLHYSGVAIPQFSQSPGQYLAPVTQHPTPTLTQHAAPMQYVASPVANHSPSAQYSTPPAGAPAPLSQYSVPPSSVPGSAGPPPVNSYHPHVIQPVMGNAPAAIPTPPPSSVTALPQQRGPSPMSPPPGQVVYTGQAPYTSQAPCVGHAPYTPPYTPHGQPSYQQPGGYFPPEKQPNASYVPPQGYPTPGHQQPPVSAHYYQPAPAQHPPQNTTARPLVQQAPGMLPVSQPVTQGTTTTKDSSTGFAGGVKKFWNNSSTGKKVAVGAGALMVGFMGFEAVEAIDRLGGTNLSGKHPKAAAHKINNAIKHNEGHHAAGASNPASNTGYDNNGGNGGTHDPNAGAYNTGGSVYDPSTTGYGSGSTEYGDSFSAASGGGVYQNYGTSDPSFSADTSGYGGDGGGDASGCYDDSSDDLATAQAEMWGAAEDSLATEEGFACMDDAIF